MGGTRTCAWARSERTTRIERQVCARPWKRLEREFSIYNLLVRIHFIIEMIMWTGLAPWEFEFPFPGSLISTFLEEMPKP